MLDVGVIGIGPHWESRYRPALEASRHRLRVRAVCSCVTALAETVATEFRAEVAPSITALAERSDIRALLILEPGWQGEVPALLALRRGKPVFLSLAAEPEMTEALEQLQEGGFIMPELPLRYTPATQRLRELLATRLGRVRRVQIELAVAADGAGRPSLVDALDWCRSLIGDCVARVVSSGPERTVQLALCRASGEAITVDVRWTSHSMGTLASEITCERGTVSLKGPRQLGWQADQHQGDESLEADRSALEVMLDHFSRRVVGGLVPVPTLDDITSARRLTRLIDVA